MFSNTNRKCIYAKDIALITGKSYRQACRILNTIKKHYNKTTTQYLCISEFCEYTGIPLEVVQEKVK